MISLRSRVEGALVGNLLGDALAVPVHWYYNVEDIANEYGRVSDFLPTPEEHPKSFMKLPAEEEEKSVIGRVILKGKKEYWVAGGRHYHRGLKAGENSLNAECARLVMRSIASTSGEYSSDDFLQKYVEFMTGEGTHNDTFAEGIHRNFFTNMDAGKELKECGDGFTHPHIGGLVMLPPIVLSCVQNGDVAKAKEVAKQHVSLYNKSEELATAAAVYAEMLMRVVKGEDLKEVCLAAAASFDTDLEKLVGEDKADTEVAGKKFSIACDVSSAFPIVLYFAYKYADNAEQAVIANTNCGGDNCHRGSVLGAILGASGGLDVFPTRWTSSLAKREEVNHEVDVFMEKCGIVD